MRFHSNVNKRSKISKYQLRKKFCRFCKNPNLEINYKNTELIKKFITAGGKILSRRISGTCSKHQRKLAREIKRARQMALIPYMGE
jgi:small subunit ribosomal protein S18